MAEWNWTVSFVLWPLHSISGDVRPNFTPAAETFAAIQALDSLVSYPSAVESNFVVKNEAWVLVDRKDSYSLLTTQRSFVNRYVHHDVNCISTMRKTELDSMGYILGSCIHVNFDNKPNRSLTDALALMLVTGRLHLDISSCGRKLSNRSLGWK